MGNAERRRNTVRSSFLRKESEPKPRRPTVPTFVANPRPSKHRSSIAQLASALDIIKRESTSFVTPPEEPDYNVMLEINATLAPLRDRRKTITAALSKLKKVGQR